MPLPPNLERSSPGILVNDLNGLCLISKGNMSSSATTNTNTNNSGVYTSLTRLASTLTPYQTANMNNENPPSPLITIELEGASSILIKEYDGHTVAMKVPNRKNTNDQGTAA
ncbi:hypothetical protein FRACYDRAFT_240285 [Fragilariopsis cylindrus CCMP1102]|uniref:Uncharacterized protein n=1 Tax=Fragilariopsis cylindrus CCMP1102 TaxID=635003 RepID=A0A1E7FBQ0_9STRA|nr:hypothetical protein FRACYDRAFT_240285 [Fragilariopsis cylindrus CCMP1102]|eukprot:OEU15592.1 hypothetical protein FRACYDRAFT_240285 [Fragilariopsis cylindrus CCMP1102]